MSRDQIICLLNNSDKYSKEITGHHIHTLETEDARLLLESSPEASFQFHYFYMNMTHYYQHFLQQVGNIHQIYKDILHKSCTCAKGIHDI